VVTAGNFKTTEVSGSKSVAPSLSDSGSAPCRNPQPSHPAASIPAGLRHCPRQQLARPTSNHRLINPGCHFRLHRRQPPPSLRQLLHLPAGSTAPPPLSSDDPLGKPRQLPTRQAGARAGREKPVRSPPSCRGIAVAVRFIPGPGGRHQAGGGNAAGLAGEAPAVAGGQGAAGEGRAGGAGRGGRRAAAALRPLAPLLGRRAREALGRWGLRRGGGEWRRGGVQPVRRGLGLGWRRRVPALRLPGLPVPRRRLPMRRERPPRGVLHQVALAAVALPSSQVRFVAVFFLASVVPCPPSPECRDWFARLVRAEEACAGILLALGCFGARRHSIFFAKFRQDPTARGDLLLLPTSRRHVLAFVSPAALTT
jgi:hypothetical protein